MRPKARAASSMTRRHCDSSARSPATSAAHGPADAAVRARDHGDAVLEPPEAAIALLSVVRPRRHLAVAAGVLLLLLREGRLLSLLLGVVRHGGLLPAGGGQR